MLLFFSYFITPSQVSLRSKDLFLYFEKQNTKTKTVWVVGKGNKELCRQMEQQDEQRTKKTERQHNQQREAILSKGLVAVIRAISNTAAHTQFLSGHKGYDLINFLMDSMGNTPT